MDRFKIILGQAPDIVTILALALLLCSATPLLKSGGMIVDTLSNFTLQYAILALILMVVACAMHMTGAITPLCIALLLCTVQLAPMLAFSSPAAAMGKPVKILQANVLKTNKDTQKLLALIEKEKPDVIVLSETTSAHDKAFSDLLPAYPYRHIAKRDDASSFGMAVLSRLPVEQAEETFFDNESIPAILMTLRIDQKKFDLLSLHPMNPLVDIGSRNNEFQKIGDRYSMRNGNPLILAGDMNATPYSGFFRESMADAGVKNARRGFGVNGTYPSWLPALLRLPIDHVLVSKGIAVLDFRLGDDIDSDHLPTITEVALRNR